MTACNILRVFGERGGVRSRAKWLLINNTFVYGGRGFVHGKATVRAAVIAESVSVRYRPIGEAVAAAILKIVGAFRSGPTRRGHHLFAVLLAFNGCFQSMRHS
jgi:hypothetical protein